MPDGPLLTSTEAAQRIGEMAMEALDNAREDFVEDPTAALEIALAVVVVSHATEDGPEDGRATAVTYWCEDGRRFVHLGLLHGALLAAEDAD